MKNKRLVALLASPLLFFVVLLGWARFNTVLAAKASSLTETANGVEPIVQKSGVHPITEAYLTIRPYLPDASVLENALILEGIVFLAVGLIWSRRVREKSA
jgi:hypothetical protein